MRISRALPCSVSLRMRGSSEIRDARVLRPGPQQSVKPWALWRSTTTFRSSMAGTSAWRAGTWNRRSNATVRRSPRCFNSANSRSVLAGGHEITWASYLGVRGAFPDARLGIINLDAHFDNRPDEQATSGTGFAQIMAAETDHPTLVLAMGIAEASNTTDLFNRARQTGIGWITDDRWITYPNEAGQAVAQLLQQVDIVYLTVDLDVLPAAVAPAVSAPAAYGVPLPLVSAVVDHVAASGKLVHADIAELNPSLDNTNATASVAARFVHRLTTAARGRHLIAASAPESGQPQGVEYHQDR